METICDIFSFLPAENILASNWTCLRLFRASEILYRPLHRPYQKRILKNLCITFNNDHNGNPFASAKFKFRLLENDDVYVRKYTFKCRRYQDSQDYWNSKPKHSIILTDNCLLGIHRSHTDKCWPNGPHLVQSLPTEGLPSDIVTIERIDLSLSVDEQQLRHYGNYIQELVSKISRHHSFKLIFPFKLGQNL